MTPDGDGPFGFGLLPFGGDDDDDVGTEVLFNLRADLTEVERAADALEEVESALESAQRELPPASLLEETDLTVGGGRVAGAGFRRPAVDRDLKEGVREASNILVDVQTLNQRIQGLVEDVERDLHGGQEGVL